MSADATTWPDSTARPALSSGLFLVPYARNTFFVGRKDVLTKLRRRFKSQKRAALGQAIRGLGGIGKTQTAVEFAYSFRSDYEHVLWVNAETISDLTVGYLHVADALQLPSNPSDSRSTVLAVKSWLRTSPGWILIFDNADTPELLVDFLPPEVAGDVLITSRACQFDGSLGLLDPITIEPLEISQATKFLLQRSARQKSDTQEKTAAQLFAAEVDGLPLALEIAAAYVFKLKSRWDEFLKVFRRERLKLLRTGAEDLKPRLSIATTWQLNLAALENNPASKDLLHFSAFLSPDAIPFELLTIGATVLGASITAHFASASENPLLVYELLLPLAQFSLVEIDREERTYSIHRVLQEVVRDSFDRNAQRIWVERTVLAISAARPPIDPSEWKSWERILPHLLSYHGHCLQYGLRTTLLATVLAWTGIYLHKRGRDSQAEPILNHALQIRCDILGELNPDVAESLNHLGVVYKSQGRYKAAEVLLLRADMVLRQIGMVKHVHYASNLTDLGSIFTHQRRYAEAAASHKQAIEIHRALSGEGSAQFAVCLNNLACVYVLEKRFTDAEPLHKQAVAISRKELGKTHPGFALALHNLADLYKSQGRFEEAEPLFEQALQVNCNALGESHVHVAMNLSNLASVYTKQGRLVEAENCYMRALKIRRETSGESHPEYAITISNLAGLYCLANRYDEAEQLLVKSVEICRTALGEAHPDFALSLENLDTFYRMRNVPRVNA